MWDLQRKSGWVQTNNLTLLTRLCEYWNKGRLYEILGEYDRLTPSILRERKERGWLYRERGRLAGFALGRQEHQCWQIEELWGPCEGVSETDQPTHRNDVDRARLFRRLLGNLSPSVLIRAPIDNPFANILAKLVGAKWFGGFLLSKKSVKRECKVSISPGCLLREFRPGDEHHLSRIHMNAFGYAQPPDEYRKWATAPNCRTTLAFLDRKVVGFFIAERRPYKKYGDFNIAVDPSFHGRGVGSVLLQKGLDDLYDMDVRTAIADFLLLNARAQSLYRKPGFQIVRAYNYYKWQKRPGSVLKTTST